MDSVSPSLPSQPRLSDSVSTLAARRYEKRADLAAGGMGVVFRVFDRVAGELRAMKRLSADLVESRSAVEAFEREYHTLASLDHPRIIRVYDYGVDDLGPYYTMELLEGEDLSEIGPFPFKTACLHLRDIATSLALLHARRLLHRDVSPSNVRVTKDGHCKLIDFGALTGFGYSPRVVGTPPVIPPEAFAGSSLDQRADLYGLGALAYWMLTGRHAYPAHHIQELPTTWAIAPRRPSSLVGDIPKELDTLVLSLIHGDPLARPGSAAEVIARLNVIGGLPPDTLEADRLADAALLNPRFTGRREELRTLQAGLESAKSGKGGAVCIRGAAGMGRSRLLDELGVRAQLAGMTVVRADAEACGSDRGLLRSLALRLLDVVPEVAVRVAPPYHATLATLGTDVETRVRKRIAKVPVEPPPESHPGRPLDEWIGEISRVKPLLIQIDNVEFADPDGLAVLIAIARIAARRPLLLVVTERLDTGEPRTMGMRILDGHSVSMQLTGLSADDMLEFTRSLFGDAPNVERLAAWLKERTAGSPLHAVETCRQLAGKRIVRYQSGIWTLPMERPEGELSEGPTDTFSPRITSLSDGARRLAECLSLHREPPTLELCRRLVDTSDTRRILAILDELASKDVLYADGEGYHFSSTLLRETLRNGMAEDRLEQNHLRLGEELSERAGDDPKLRIDAGWHLIQGGSASRGAEMIAATANNGWVMRTLAANRFRAALPVEAALRVYRRERRSAYERMPLLAVLADAGYYEGRTWGELYGDEALDVLEELSGVAVARSLQKFLGKTLAIFVGLFLAYLRFQFVPRRERKYEFALILELLFSVTSTLTGVASMSLDADRAARIAATLEPFSTLSPKHTAVGIYQFCRGLSLIASEHEAEAEALFTMLVERFNDPGYYTTMPADARKLYLAGAHFARASCTMFRAHGASTLTTADALDKVGLKLYTMIASQLRVLYYTLRGELELAAPHREQVELHAAHVGSAWQVETWTLLALALLHSGPVRDIVSATRVVHRLELVTRSVPGLRKHCRFAKDALLLARGEPSFVTNVAKEYAWHIPRTYRGWAARQGHLAQAYNELGQHAEAKDVCERTARHMTDADREYVMLFLLVDRELAIADAGLGNVDLALQRIDGLLARFADCDHPLVHGLLHEARGQIAWRNGDTLAYEKSLAEVERWFRPTSTPALIDKCVKLAALAQQGLHDAKGGPAEAETVSRIAIAEGTEHVNTETAPVEA